MGYKFSKRHLMLSKFFAPGRPLSAAFCPILRCSSVDDAFIAEQRPQIERILNLTDNPVFGKKISIILPSRRWQVPDRPPAVPLDETGLPLFPHTRRSARATAAPSSGCGPLAAGSLAHAARRALRDPIGAGQAVLIHEMANEFGGARRPGRPAAISSARAHNRAASAGGFGIPDRFNQRAGARELRVVVYKDKVRIPHTVSASMASYSRWAPKNRMATPARYCSAATRRKSFPLMLNTTRPTLRILPCDGPPSRPRDCVIARAARSATMLHIASARP